MLVQYLPKDRVLVTKSTSEGVPTASRPRTASTSTAPTRPATTARIGAERRSGQPARSSPPRSGHQESGSGNVGVRTEIPAKQVVKARIAKPLKDVVEAQTP